MENDPRYTYTFEPMSEYGAVNPQNTVNISEEPEKKHRKGWTAGRIIALALVCALLGGAGGVGGVFLGQKLLGSGVSEDTVNNTEMLLGSRDVEVVSTTHIDTSNELTLAQVYAMNVGSTVGIQTTITTNYWGYQTTSAASGSGFILTADGYILTNYHVIESSRTITVSLYDGTSYDAALVGCDQNNDIAVLKIQAENLVPVVLGDSDQLQVGDTVAAIGNPLGELTFSLTHGVISALSREVTFSDGLTMDLIQTDCAINSGNSGGALFNLYGEVVGITNAKYSSSSSSSEASIDNIGFAIPINQVRSIVTSIIETGSITKPYIGVSVTNVSSDAIRFGLPEGAAISSVTEGGPADKAGLQEDDIIVAVDDTEITGSQSLVDVVSNSEPGDTLVFTVYRQGKTIEISVTVEEQVSSALPVEEEDDEEALPSDGYSTFPWGWFGH